MLFFLIIYTYMGKKKICIALTFYGKAIPNNTCRRKSKQTKIKTKRKKQQKPSLSSKCWPQDMFMPAKWKNSFLVFDCCLETAALKTHTKCTEKNERTLVFKLPAEKHPWSTAFSCHLQNKLMNKHKTTTSYLEGAKKSRQKTDQ